MRTLSSEPGARRFSRRALIQAGAVCAGGLGLTVAGHGWAGSGAASGTPEAGGTPTPPHWAYEGDEGPDHWGDLDPGYASCSIGQEQSPVDLIDPASGDLSGLAFSGPPLAPVTIVNTGHTIQVNAPPGITVTLDEVTYELVQFHFHTPSEHAVAGQPQAMELHLVHQDEHGALMVLGVLLAEGVESAALAPVFEHLPLIAGEERIVDGTIALSELLPADRRAYRYAGSLTTPPCSEGVAWVVFAQPMEISRAQIDAFRAIYPENARPLQPLNDRDIVDGQ